MATTKASKKAAAKPATKKAGAKPAAPKPETILKSVENENSNEKLQPGDNAIADNSGAAVDNAGTSTDSSGSSDNTGTASDVATQPCNGNCGSNHCDTNGCSERERYPVVGGANETSRSLAYAIASHEPCVVIPYKKDSAAGQELLYALRAWEENLPGCQIVIVGDREDWFSDSIIVIDAPVQSDNPQIDVAYKMLLAIADHQVPERFIWSNDDIYPVTPLHPADLELLTSEGMLQAGKLSSVYGQNKSNTIEFLTSVNAPTHDYSTHTPFTFDKEDLARVIAISGATETGMLISSLYFNLVHPDVVPLRIDGGANGGYFCKIHRNDPPYNIMKAAFYNRKFVNVNNAGYQAALPILQEKFPDKSRFES